MQWKDGTLTKMMQIEKVEEELVEHKCSKTGKLVEIRIPRLEEPELMRLDLYFTFCIVKLITFNESSLYLV